MLSELDALSWISLTILAVMLLAVAAGWLRAKSAGRKYGFYAPLSSYGWDTLAGLLLGCVLFLGVKGFIDFRVKEIALDGWLDGVVDAIDGDNDHEERIARGRGGAHYAPVDT